MKATMLRYDEGGAFRGSRGFAKLYQANLAHGLAGERLAGMTKNTCVSIPPLHFSPGVAALTTSFVWKSSGVRRLRREALYRPRGGCRRVWEVGGAVENLRGRGNSASRTAGRTPKRRRASGTAALEGKSKARPDGHRPHSARLLRSVFWWGSRA